MAIRCPTERIRARWASSLGGVDFGRIGVGRIIIGRVSRILSIWNRIRNIDRFADGEKIVIPILPASIVTPAPVVVALVAPTMVTREERRIRTRGQEKVSAAVSKDGTAVAITIRPQRGNAGPDTGSRIGVAAETEGCDRSRNASSLSLGGPTCGREE